MAPEVWYSLASLAYEQFVRQGRGALLLTEVGDALIPSLTATYVNETQAVCRDPDGYLRKHLREYDPMNEVVVLVVDANGVDYSVHRLEQRPRPGAIHAACARISGADRPPMSH